MERSHKKALKLSLGGLLCLAILASLFFGSSGLSVGHLLSAIFNLRGGEGLKGLSYDVEVAAQIFWQVRVPRTLLVALVGGTLASSGVLTQGLFRNPLASPSLLSVEAGAGLAGVLVLFYGDGMSPWYLLPLVSAGGAWLTTALMLLWARSSRGNTANLLLTGVALGSFFAAASSFLVSLHSGDNNRTSMVMRWLLGGVAGRGFEHLPMILVPLVLGIILIRRFLPSFDTLVLGESTATTLGVPIPHLRWTTVFVVGLWIGGAVAVAGNIPFVGLIVPHMGRRLFGSRVSPLLWGSFVLGTLLTLIADTLGRTIRAPQEIEVGVVMALVGSPLFLWILHKSLGSRGDQGGLA